MNSIEILMNAKEMIICLKNLSKPIRESEKKTQGQKYGEDS